MSSGVEDEWVGEEAVSERGSDPQGKLDDLEAEVVEDLDGAEDAEDVRGGTAGCMTFTR